MSQGLAGFFAGVGASAIVLILMAASSSAPLDSTDNHLTGERSNLRINIDHGTGCQYLRAIGGGITPRLDGAGKHICVPKGSPANG